MKLKGEIILIDEQEYELDFLKLSLDELDYEIQIKYFKGAKVALEYLKKSNEYLFLIISDLHLPQITGLELKKIIDADKELQMKSIPFVFASISATNEEITECYKYNMQGFFIKPMELDKMTKMLDIIIRYWVINVHPSKKSHSNFKEEHLVMDKV